MNNIDSILSFLISNEEKLCLYDYKFNNIPIWRLFRFSSRNKFIKIKLSQYTNNSLKRNRFILYCDIIKRSFFSLFELIIFYFSKKRVDNLFMAFPRLQNINKKYIDKFTDPVIDQSRLADSCIVLQTCGSHVYKGIRWRNERVVNIDLLYVVSAILTYFYLPIFIFKKQSQEIKKLYQKANDIYLLNKFDLIKWHIIFCRFYILSIFFKFIFIRHRVKRLFVVDREIFFPQIYAAHKLNINVYEFQHGVTSGATVLYSGKYSKILDPDFFLVFGSKWIGPQFSIPIKQIINIGWAYKDFICSRIKFKDIKSNAILFISSPEITNKIIKAIIELSRIYPDKEFHIRCHPQERISDKLIASIALYDNIYITDNSVDSYVALSSYEHIVGENSTVLYEALSLGKNVARLSYGGFSPSGMDNSVDDNFYYLKSASDFEDFLKNENMNYVDENGIYSPFDANKINNLIL